MSNAADDRPADGAVAESGAPGTAGSEGQAQGHSVAGIVSCGLFALVLAMVIVFRVLKPGEGATEAAQRTARLLTMISVRVAFFVMLLGVVFALFGVAQHCRKRALAVVGLLLNGLPFLAVLVQTVARAFG
jgi:hypothetical protein